MNRPIAPAWAWVVLVATSSTGCLRPGAVTVMSDTAAAAVADRVVEAIERHLPPPPDTPDRADLWTAIGSLAGLYLANQGRKWWNRRNGKG